MAWTIDPCPNVEIPFLSQCFHSLSRTCVIFEVDVVSVLQCVLMMVSDRIVSLDGPAGHLWSKVWCAIGSCFSLQRESEAAVKFFRRAVQVRFISSLLLLPDYLDESTYSTVPVKSWLLICVESNIIDKHSKVHITDTGSEYILRVLDSKSTQF